MQVKSDVKSTGDLGTVAEKSKSNQKTMFKPARLTVKGVFDKLKDISEMTGHAVVYFDPYFKYISSYLILIFVFFTY